MARFGLVGGSYASRSRNADCQTLMNWYLEPIESGQGKGAMALYDRPGLRLFCNLGTSGGRGVITAQGRTFAIAGAQLWEIFANGTKTARGGIVSDGKSVSMANGQTQILIASAGIAYVFDLGTNALTDISAIFGAPPVLQVGYSDGFFLALVQGPSTNLIYASDLQNAASWDLTSFTGISVFPDRASAIFVDHRELWVWGPRATQPHFNSGNFPFPFDIVQGGFIESGIGAAFSPAKADNSIFWLEGDDRGTPIVRRANGYTPQRVSNHAIEYEFSTYSTIRDAVGYSYKEAGHEFYVLSFPTADKMWAFDTATGQWAERGYWNQSAGVFTRHRAQYHTFNTVFGKHLVLDPTNGNVYEQSTAFFTDADNPLVRIRRAPHISTEQQPVRHISLQLDVETGLASFAGTLAPTSILLVDGGGVCRSLGIAEGGTLQAPINSLADPDLAEQLFMNDTTGTTSWEITISDVGIITGTQQAAFDASFPSALTFISALGDQRWTLQLIDLGTGHCTLETITQGAVTRGPIVSMRYSDDSARSWSHPKELDCGAIGEYRKRVIWRRLGRSRDRVYEIRTSDAAPCRIIDAYLTASGMEPQKRFAREASERA